MISTSVVAAVFALVIWRGNSMKQDAGIEIYTALNATEVTKEVETSEGKLYFFEEIDFGLGVQMGEAGGEQGDSNEEEKNR